MTLLRPGYGAPDDDGGTEAQVALPPDGSAQEPSWQSAALRGLSPEHEGLLGDYPADLVRLSGSSDALAEHELQGYRACGSRAAEAGEPLPAMISLYLSVARRLWPHLPALTTAVGDDARVHAVGQRVLQAVDDIITALADGYQVTRRALVRSQEAARREFIDDLLTGRSGLGSLLDRAGQFGLELAGPHVVAVVRAERLFTDGSPLLGQVERAVQADRPSAALVATKDGLLIAVVPAGEDVRGERAAQDIARALGERDPARPAGRWQIGLGRPAPSPATLAQSYAEAVSALDLAGRLDLDAPIVSAADLLVYQVLLRDRTAVLDLIATTLSGLTQVRGGARPLLETLHVYFSSGGNTAETARLMHLSVRAVSYRLERVREAIGLDPLDGRVRFTLQAAVLGARLLDWPPDPPVGGRARPHLTAAVVAGTRQGTTT